VLTTYSKIYPYHAIKPANPQPEPDEWAFGAFSRGVYKNSLVTNPLLIISPQDGQQHGSHRLNPTTQALHQSRAQQSSSLSSSGCTRPSSSHLLAVAQRLKPTRPLLGKWIRETGCLHQSARLVSRHQQNLIWRPRRTIIRSTRGG
jgi:hypothetical protein